MPGNSRKARRKHLTRALQLAEMLQREGQLTAEGADWPLEIRKELQSLP